MQSVLQSSLFVVLSIVSVIYLAHAKWTGKQSSERSIPASKSSPPEANETACLAKQLFTRKVRVEDTLWNQEDETANDKLVAHGIKDKSGSKARRQAPSRKNAGGTETKSWADVASNTNCRPAPELPLPCDKTTDPEPSKTGGGGYRLGDVVKIRDRWNLSAWHLTHFPNSLASMYVRACGTRGIWAVFLDCVHRKYAKEDRERVNQNATDVVIHLRLGDVLDDDVRRKIPLAEYLRDWVEWRPGNGLYYVPPLSAYARLEIPRETQRVILMGNPYFRVGENCSRSFGYVEAVTRELQRIRPGLEIATRFPPPPSSQLRESLVEMATRFPPPPGSQERRTLEESELADRDIHFVQSRATVFVASRGGFSHLLAMVATSAGHKVDWHVRKSRAASGGDVGDGGRSGGQL